MKGTKEKPFDNIFELMIALKSMTPMLIDPMSQAIEHENVDVLQEIRGSDNKKRYIHKKEMLELYRGEPRIYDSCRPSLYRLEIGSDEQLLYLLRLEEFRHALSKNPAIAAIEHEGNFVDYSGLAGHYGLHSDTLNLTASLDMAAFFACCSFDGATYCAVEEGVGVVYKLLRLALADLKTTRKYENIGLPPFDRPTKQRAYSFKMAAGEDFITTAVPYYFRQSRSASERLLLDYEKGRILIPDKPIANLVERIKMNFTLSYKALCHVYEKNTVLFDANLEIYINRLRAKGFSLITS